MISIMLNGIMGKMGQTLLRLINDRTDCKVVCGIDIKDSVCSDIPVYGDVFSIKEKIDVVIDFSTPLASLNAISYCKEKNIPIVVCTTGFDDTALEKIDSASEKIPVFHSANMSIGINLLSELCKIANTVLGEDFDIEIVEKHHNRKVDAPSGTALLLADEINNNAGNKYNYVYDRQSVRKPRDKKEIGLHAIRGGTIVGEHDVLFCGNDEVITLNHSASSRDVFANGAIKAAIYLTDKPSGKYSMKDMVKISL